MLIAASLLTSPESSSATPAAAGPQTHNSACKQEDEDNNELWSEHRGTLHPGCSTFNSISKLLPDFPNLCRDIEERNDNNDNNEKTATQKRTAIWTTWNSKRQNRIIPIENKIRIEIKLQYINKNNKIHWWIQLQLEIN